MPENDQLIEKGRAALERRAMFKRAGLGLAGAAALTALGKGALAPTPAAAATTAQTPTSSPTQLDVNILNFALNLEYLEAQYYLNAVTGTGLTAAQLAGGNNQAGGTPVPAGTTAVSFATPIIRQYAQTICADEVAHVTFLKGALATAAVPAPVLDVSAAGAFTTLAKAAGVITSGVFNPYQDENAFLIGAYIFEDVGVTAYGGAAALLSQGSALVQYAASILAIEAYHAGTIRTLLTIRGGGATTDAISNLRSTLSSGATSGAAQGDDFGTFDTVNNVVVLAPRDAMALTYRRSVGQVLNIVYGSSTRTPGLFFPNGMSQQAGQTGFA